MDMDITYTKVGGVVKIHRPFQDDIVLNEESARQAVENVKRNHTAYRTEEAYLRHLKMYQDAFAMFSQKEELK